MTRGRIISSFSGIALVGLLTCSIKAAEPEAIRHGDLSRNTGVVRQTGLRGYITPPTQTNTQSIQTNAAFFEDTDASSGSGQDEPKGWLMQQIQCTPLASWLDCNGIAIGGWMEQGVTWNSDSPDNRFNHPMTFNDRSNEYQLNQLWLYAEKAIDTQGCCWDFGGRVDMFWGSDYYFTQATGLELEQDGTQKWNSEDGPRVQFGPGNLYGLSLPQAYAEIFAPIGSGLRVKVGHFYTIIGYERIPAPANFFYSHALTMRYGEPLTHTGWLASYGLTDRIKVQGGMTFGSDNFTNPNDNVGFLGGISWTSCDDKTNLAYALHVADEFDGVRRDDTRFVQSVVLTHEITTGLRYVLQSDLGFEDRGQVPLANEDAEWYGLNSNLFYDITDCLSAGVRAEWFRDDDHARVWNTPIAADGGNYYEMSVGLNYRPYENLMVRPEARWDWSDTDLRDLGAVGVYDDFSDKNQFTIGLDVIWTF
jgi:hypothetical protein